MSLLSSMPITSFMSFMSFMRQRGKALACVIGELLMAASQSDVMTTISDGMTTTLLYTIVFTNG